MRVTIERVPGVTGVAWVRAVTHGQREVFVDSVRNDTSRNPEGNPDFTIHPATKAETHYVVTYIEPALPNAAAAGLDIGFETTRHSAIAETMTTGQAVVTGNITLVQQDSTDRGFLVLLGNQEAGPRHGLVDAVHTANNTFRFIAHGPQAVAAAPFAIYDVGAAGHDITNWAPTPEARLFASDDDAATNAFLERPATTVLRIDVPGRTWAVAIAEPTGLVGAAERLAPTIIYASGSLVSVLLAGIVLLLGTSRARAEAEVAARTAELQATTSELQRSNDDLEAFAYAISHDLREPLRTIRSFTDLIERHAGKKLDNNEHEYMAFVRAGVDRMSRMIEDMLHLSRVGNADPMVRAIALETIVEDVRGSLRDQIAMTDARVESDGLATIHADADQVYMVLQNLVSNALRYHGEKPPRVTVSTAKAPGATKIMVTDNGLGIDPAYHRRIFEPYRRLHGPMHEGSGLGLTLCKKIIHRHGGEIGVDSEEGQGATFWFTIPDP